MEEKYERDHALNLAELNDLANMLINARKAANMTIEDVVEQSKGELKISTVKNLERGIYFVNIRDLIAYARTIGVKIAAIPTDQ